MKIGYIAKSNKKGQVVIPKEIREKLGIGEDASLNMVVREHAVYMYPVKEVLGDAKQDVSYLKLLEMTKGTWKEDWPKLRKRRRAIELAASRKRKAW